MTRSLDKLLNTIWAKEVGSTRRQMKDFLMPKSLTPLLPDFRSFTVRQYTTGFVPLCRLESVEV